MKNIKVILSVCMIGVIFVSIVLYRTNNEPLRDQTLVVGMMSGWAPFMSINSQGQIEGFDVDVAQEIAQRMNKKLVVQDIGSLAPCFIALEQNKIDMIMSGLDITPARMKSMNMIRYTGQDVKNYTLVFWNQAPQGVSTIDDLKDIPNPVVCVEPGISTEKLLERYPFITKKSLAALSEMILDIQYGKSLAAFLEPQVAARAQAKNPQIKTIAVPLPREFQIYGLGIAVAQKRKEFALQVEAIIKKMREDGTLKALETKWQLEGAQ